MGWLTGWSTRTRLTVDGTVPGLSGAISNGIAIVGVPAGLKALCGIAGADLRFTADDGTTLLDYGIEDWSAAAPVCHVRIPTVGTGDTAIYAYGGNGLALDAQNRPGVATGYAGYWPLGDAGPTTAYDWTANANDGTQSGGVTFGAAGQAGPACLIDATNDFFSLPPAASLSLSRMTLAAWVKPTAFTTSYPTILRRFGTVDSGNYENYHLRISSAAVNDKRVRFRIGNGSSNVTADSAGTLTAGSWAHVAATYDGANMRVYLNGAADGVAPTTITPYTVAVAQTSIGAYLNLTGDPSFELNSTLDQVCIAPTALTADQIKFAAKSYPGSTMFTFGALDAAPVSVYFRRSWGGTRTGSRGVL